MIFAIDPGTTKSAYVLFDPEKQCIVDMGIQENEPLVRALTFGTKRMTHLAIERVASFGFCVGKEIFETCEWVGRFVQACYTKCAVEPVYRKQVVVHHTGSAKGGDSAVRAAMIRRFGNATGCKYDLWSALAIGSFVADKLCGKVSVTSPRRRPGSGRGDIYDA